MREIKKYVRFYVQKRTTWKDQSPQRPRNIVMAFNYDGKRLCTLTGLKVPECDWDNARQRVKLNVKRSGEVNNYLNLLEQKVNDAYYGALGKDINPDNNYLIKELKKDKKKEKLSFIEEWKKYLEMRKGNMKANSLLTLNISFGHFKDFAKGKRLDFDDITPNLVSEFATYLFGLGHVDNTVYKHLKGLRAVMAHGRKAGLHNNEHYKDFNVSQKSSRIVFLDWSEVKILLDYKPENQLERKVLDCFLWGCLTAMRIGDTKALKASDVVQVKFDGLSDVYYAANIRQMKTSKTNVIPLLPEAMAILERNKGIKGGYALPRVCEQLINRHIKEIGRKAGLNSMLPVDRFRGDVRETTYHEKWKLLKTHIGRKTFISVAASRSIPIHIVAAVAGHSIKTCMQFYAGVADKDRFVKVMETMKFAETPLKN